MTSKKLHFTFTNQLMTQYMWNTLKVCAAQDTGLINSVETSFKAHQWLILQKSHKQKSHTTKSYACKNLSGYFPVSPAHSPRHAKHFHWLLRRCRSGCWSPEGPGHPTCYWVWLSSPSLQASCCCIGVSWWASPRSSSAALSGCHCPYSVRSFKITCKHTHYSI